MCAVRVRPHTYMAGRHDVRVRGTTHRIARYIRGTGGGPGSLGICSVGGCLPNQGHVVEWTPATQRSRT